MENENEKVKFWMKVYECKKVYFFRRKYTNTKNNHILDASMQMQINLQFFY